MNFLGIEGDVRLKHLDSYKRKMKYFDTLAAILGFVGWLAQYSAYEKYYDEIKVTREDTNGNKYTDLLLQNESSTVVSLRFLQTLSTIALLICVMFRYKYFNEIYLAENRSFKMLSGQSNKKKAFDPDAKFRKRQRIKLVLELIFLSIHMVPFVNFNIRMDQQKQRLEYSLDLFVFVFMFGRVYLLKRLVRHYTKWMKKEAYEVCQIQGAKGGEDFAMRALLKERPMLLVGTLLSLLMIIGGLSMRAFERPYSHASGQEWDNYINGIWCTFAVVTTVGYGDFFPTTHLGRLCAVLVCILGQFFMSLVIAAVTSLADFDIGQQRAYYKILYKEKQDNLKRLGIEYVKFAFLTTLSKVKEDPAKGSKYYRKFKQYSGEFRKVRDEFEKENINIPMVLLMSLARHSIQEKKFDIIRAFRKQEGLKDKIEELEKTFSIQENKLDDLKSGNKHILQVLKKLKQKGTKHEDYDNLQENPDGIKYFNLFTKKQIPTTPFDGQSTAFLLKRKVPILTLTNIQARVYRRVARVEKAIRPEIKSLFSKKEFNLKRLEERKRIVRQMEQDTNKLDKILNVLATSKRRRKSVTTISTLPFQKAKQLEELNNNNASGSSEQPYDDDVSDLNDSEFSGETNKRSRGNSKKSKKKNKRNKKNYSYSNSPSRDNYSKEYYTTEQNPDSSPSRRGIRKVDSGESIKSPKKRVSILEVGEHKTRRKSTFSMMQVNDSNHQSQEDDGTIETLQTSSYDSDELESPSISPRRKAQSKSPKKSKQKSLKNSYATQLSKSRSTNQTNSTEVEEQQQQHWDKQPKKIPKSKTGIPSHQLLESRKQQLLNSGGKEVAPPMPLWGNDHKLEQKPKAKIWGKNIMTTTSSPKKKDQKDEIDVDIAEKKQNNPAYDFMYATIDHDNLNDEKQKNLSPTSKSKNKLLKEKSKTVAEIKEEKEQEKKKKKEQKEAKEQAAKVQKEQQEAEAAKKDPVLKSLSKMFDKFMSIDNGERNNLDDTDDDDEDSEAYKSDVQVPKARTIWDNFKSKAALKKYSNAAEERGVPKILRPKQKHKLKEPSSIITSAKSTQRALLINDQSTDRSQLTPMDGNNGTQRGVITIPGDKLKKVIKKASVDLEPKGPQQEFTKAVSSVLYGNNFLRSLNDRQLSPTRNPTKNLSNLNESNSPLQSHVMPSIANGLENANKNPDKQSDNNQPMSMYEQNAQMRGGSRRTSFVKSGLNIINNSMNTSASPAKSLQRVISGQNYEFGNAIDYERRVQREEQRLDLAMPNKVNYKSKQVDHDVMRGISNQEGSPKNKLIQQMKNLNPRKAASEQTPQQNLLNMISQLNQREDEKSKAQAKLFSQKFMQE